MTSLQGFGSADVTAPFNYGSVADGIRHSPTLEQKLKKKYWKTKQTVIQKLHKSQDEFVVAGDADIDTKLEVERDSLSACECGLWLVSCAGGLPLEVLLSPVAPHSGEVLLQTQR